VSGLTSSEKIGIDLRNLLGNYSVPIIWGDIDPEKWDPSLKLLLLAQY
jgi:hypothetical protein